MRILRAADIARVVEWGEDKHALDRACMLLRIALPEASREQLAQLPLGVRDRLIFEVRRSLFGSDLDLSVRCHACGEELEFQIRVEQLLKEPAPTESEYFLAIDEYELKFRLPNSQDLAGVVGIDSAQEARKALLRACTLESCLQGQKIEFERLPKEICDQLAQRMGKLDPQSDISFKLQCEGCQRPIRASLDGVQYLWTELRAYAERIQHEIHLLASAYGWDEERILAMTAARRHRYCQMVANG